MNTKLITRSIAAFGALLTCGVALSAQALDVDARLSAREAYVGQPIILQIAINNASDYELPTIPDIDGCDVRSAGAPAQSSQITIINGRRSENRSITMRYLITPRRTGAFEIPPLTVEVNGRQQRTQPLRFVATKSETGDLLFVEIEGGKDRVFVGQPLDLKLKVWIKPFVDRENNIKLSEADMWRMISDQTSWGAFAERLQQLADADQRPGGTEVLRDDGNGNERAYYLYEIDATVYPTRPGSIDADDVQIVVNYPTALGRSRDPFESFFGDSPFGRDPFSGFGGSRLSQRMRDEFFASPFGNRLSVTSARPIVAQAEVDATQVVPVPTAGRPADYRGAVGSYQIVTQATPTHVNAGDPITLQIGIAGTGPMELVQAPPLAELPSLTKDFKVEDQSLAGFVRDSTKVFPTTIRPRTEGITAIPAIPFSFFDPDTETFHTVMSEPIEIKVERAESLALDAIVGAPRRVDQDDSNSSSFRLEPNFNNFNSVSLLDSQTARHGGRGWIVLVAFPPLVWLTVLFVRQRDGVWARVGAIAGAFQSAEARSLRAMERATGREQIDVALLRFVKARTRSSNGTSPTHAIGALRSCGLYSVAADLESFFHRADHADYTTGEGFALESHRREAREMMAQLVAAFDGLSQSQVRRPKRKENRLRLSTKSLLRRPLAILLAVSGLSLAWSGNAFASSAQTTGAISSQPKIELTRDQQIGVLSEATELYAEGVALTDTDKAEANERFTQAAAKYQLLVDSGVRNGDLYFNLGNAYLQSNQLGWAIAAYENARWFEPGNRQLAVNLDFANSLVKGDESSAHVTDRFGVFVLLRRGNDAVTRALGRSVIHWTMGIASVLFWGLLTIGIFRAKLPIKRLAVIPLVVLLITAASAALTATNPIVHNNGVIVANRVVLRNGDGEQFSELATISTADGHRIRILNERGGWTQIQTRQGQTGWVPSSECTQLNSDVS